MSARWTAVAGSFLGVTDCISCGAEVASLPEKAETARCLTCHMDLHGAGDRWDLNTHPVLPGPGSDPLAYASPAHRARVLPTIAPKETSGEFFWACFDCSETGPADDVAHATVLERAHRFNYCPAMAARKSTNDDIQWLSGVPGGRVERQYGGRRR